MDIFIYVSLIWCFSKLILEIYSEEHPHKDMESSPFVRNKCALASVDIFIVQYSLSFISLESAER